jgi:zinc transport system substrate-binding protein
MWDKMNYLQSKWLTLLISLSILTGCSSPPTASNPETQISASETTSEPLDITVSILPQEYFVEKIGGDRVEVNIMVEPGASPATYEPKPQQMKALSEAEAYVSIGVPFEKAWMEKIKGANPQMLVIDSAQGVERMEMVAHHHHGEAEAEHDHEHEHDHGAENLDPHIWLSPQRVKVQAENIYQGLVEIDPENEAEYQANLAQFLTEIDQLDQQIQQNLAGVENRQFIVFHPSWGYFARDYDLEQVSIEVGGQEPSAAELGEIVKEAQEENIQVIFAQPEFSTKSAETIAQEIDGKVLLITPLAPDWSNNLLQVSQTFAEVLQKEGDTN